MPQPTQNIYSTTEQVLQYVAFLFINLPIYAAGAVIRFIRRRPLQDGAIDKRRVHAILVVRVDGLGDVVLLSGFLRGLRNAFPEAWISFVVDDKVRAFVDLCPWVNEVLGFNERGSKYKRLFLGGLRAWRLAARHLYKRNFDLAITPRWDVDSRAASLLGYFSLASWHLGFSESVTSRKGRINRGADRLYSHPIMGSPNLLHEQDRNNELLTHMNICPDTDGPELWLSKDDLLWAHEVLREVRDKSQDYLVCFGIGGVETKRLWPIERFNAVASWLITEMNAAVVIIGDGRDRRAAELLAQGPLKDRVVNLAGLCSLRRSASVLSHCDLFVGTDSGPMHIAAAAGVPVVEISCHPLTGDAGHVNSPFRYKPLSVISRVLQPPVATYPCVDGCNASSAHCIRAIEVPDVTRAIADLLTEVSAKSADSAVLSAECAGATPRMTSRISLPLHTEDRS